MLLAQIGETLKAREANSATAAVSEDLQKALVEVQTLASELSLARSEAQSSIEQLSNDLATAKDESAAAMASLRSELEEAKTAADLSARSLEEARVSCVHLSGPELL